MTIMYEIFNKLYNSLTFHAPPVHSFELLYLESGWNLWQSIFKIISISALLNGLKVFINIFTDLKESFSDSKEYLIEAYRDLIAWFMDPIVNIILTNLEFIKLYFMIALSALKFLYIFIFNPDFDSEILKMGIAAILTGMIEMDMMEIGMVEMPYTTNTNFIETNINSIKGNAMDINKIINQENVTPSTTPTSSSNPLSRPPESDNRSIEVDSRPSASSSKNIETNLPVSSDTEASGQEGTNKGENLSTELSLRHKKTVKAFFDKISYHDRYWSNLDKNNASQSQSLPSMNDYEPLDMNFFKNTLSKHYTFTDKETDDLKKLSKLCQSYNWSNSTWDEHRNKYRWDIISLVEGHINDQKKKLNEISSSEILKKLRSM